MSRSIQKELKEILDGLRDQGWRVEDVGRRYKAFPPQRQLPMVTIPKTPSGKRWRENLLGHLRRSGFRDRD